MAPRKKSLLSRSHRKTKIHDLVNTRLGKMDLSIQAVIEAMHVLETRKIPTASKEGWRKSQVAAKRNRAVKARERLNVRKGKWKGPDEGWAVENPKWYLGQKWRVLAFWPDGVATYQEARSCVRSELIGMGFVEPLGREVIESPMIPGTFNPVGVQRYRLTALGAAARDFVWWASALVACGRTAPVLGAQGQYLRAWVTGQDVVRPEKGGNCRQVGFYMGDPEEVEYPGRILESETADQ